MNKCLEAWIRVEKRKGFPPEWANIEYVKDVFQMDKNSTKPFVEKFCERGKTFEYDKKAFIDAVIEFRLSKSLYKISPWMVTKNLKEIMGAKRSIDIVKSVSKKTCPNSSGRKYIGIRIKEEFQGKFKETFNLLKYNEVKNTKLNSFTNSKEESSETPENIMENLYDKIEIEEVEDDENPLENDAVGEFNPLIEMVEKELDFSKIALEISNLYDITAKKNNIDISRENFQELLEKNNLFYLEFNDFGYLLVDLSNLDHALEEAFEKTKQEYEEEKDSLEITDEQNEIKEMIKNLKG